MAPKVLVVLTSVDKIPGHDHPTGWFLVSSLYLDRHVEQTELTTSTA